MAATLVGGAFLSASVQTMLDQLTSTQFRDFINNKKLNVSLLKQLQTTLLVLQAVLDDAEEKQINNRAVKQWLDDLKDEVFDTEDLLNQISYESLRCKVENRQTSSKKNQVLNFFSSPFKNIYGEINSQMKTMCDSLQIFAQQKDILGLKTKSARVSHRTPSSSLVNESFMVGRKDDKETIMNMLLSESSTRNNNIGVVAILGMGGVGKTTLAQLVYNDEKVQEHFDLKAWACVSEDFDILTLTKTLLESVTSRAWENNNLDFLRVELKKTLRDKRFLFVLDDLWNDNYNDWDELVTPMIKGNSGSRVIVTTRQQKVAEVAHTFPIHKLEVLSNEDTWSLLSKHAFGGENFYDNKCSNMESLSIHDCKKLSFLPPETWSNYTSLLELILRNSCNSLSTFPLDGFPKLQELFINGCTGLESIFISESSSYHPSSLQRLGVSSCESLISLPQRMDILIALESLYLHHLPKLEFALCEGVFLPPKLQTISINSLRITKMPPLIEWGFQSLTSLSELYIEDNDDIVNTLLKEQLLPFSLMFLSISNLSEMKRLDGNGLRHLSSLETLRFYNCLRLESLAEIKLPCSLQTLSFNDCPRLESLPEDNLPSSLKMLSFCKCPALEKIYENERWNNWSRITRHFGDVVVYELVLLEDLDQMD